LTPLIVRSFMTPSIAALLGRWFWWPLKVLRPLGPRQLVRSPLLGEKAKAVARPRRVVGTGAHRRNGENSVTDGTTSGVAGSRVTSGNAEA
jgi:hypothetical protein